MVEIELFAEKFDIMPMENVELQCSIGVGEMQLAGTTKKYDGWLYDTGELYGTVLLKTITGFSGDLARVLKVKHNYDTMIITLLLLMQYGNQSWLPNLNDLDISGKIDQKLFKPMGS